MAQTTPCPDCLEQVKKGRHDDPHQNLVGIASRTFRGYMSGGWEEDTYRCTVCGSLIATTNDKNEVAPWWWFTKSDK